MIGPSSQVRVSDVVVDGGQRPVDTSKVADLAASIAEIGLLNPIVITSDHSLVAGRHRLEAHRSLGLAEVAAVVVSDEDAELARIDENLMRADLTVLEQSEHLARREEILRERGLRATAGDNQHAGGGETVSPPPVTTADIARQAGLSERGAQQRTQIARSIAPDVRDALRGTDVADSTRQLLDLARMPEDEQRQVVDVIVSGASDNVRHARAVARAAGGRARMRAEVAAGSATVAHADAVAWLRSLAPASADLLLTDPPYMTDVDDVDAFASEWALLALSRLKPSGRAYIFTGAYPDELAAYLRVLGQAAGWTLDNVLVWTYRNTLGPSPRMGYKLNWQACFYLYGPDAAPLDCPVMLEQFTVQDISAPDGRQGNRLHTWQKPAEIGERFIRHSTRPGDLIIDPFAGTGTFLEAGARLGRVAIGCDIDAGMIDLCQFCGISRVEAPCAQ